jgi:hypothetical protein
MYEQEVEIVRAAIGLLESGGDPSPIRELKEEQAVAATGLEYYGITKKVFEKFLAEKDLPDSARRALEKAIEAVRVMYRKSEEGEVLQTPARRPKRIQLHSGMPHPSFHAVVPPAGLLF